MITAPLIPELEQMLAAAAALRWLADAAQALGAHEIHLDPGCYQRLAAIPHQRRTWCYADGTAIDQATAVLAGVSITAMSPERRAATAEELTRRPGTDDCWFV